MKQWLEKKHQQKQNILEFTNVADFCLFMCLSSSTNQKKKNKTVATT